MDKQGECSAQVRALSPGFEKSATEFRPKLLTYRNIVNIVTFNIRTLSIVNQLAELTAFAAEYNIDIICIQEYKYYHGKVKTKYHNAGNGHLSQDLLPLSV